MFLCLPEVLCMMIPPGDTAASFFGRLRATPVQFAVPRFDASISGGLRPNENLLLMGPTASGKTEWCIHLAATHACAGGQVYWITALASPSFDLKRFLCVLETALCRQKNVRFSALLSRFRSPEHFQDELLRISEKVHVTNCHTPMHLTATLLNVKFADNSISDRTPLVIVDGLGVGSNSLLWERVTPISVPVGAALEHAMAQSHCATVLALTTWPLPRHAKICGTRELFHVLCSPWSASLPTPPQLKHVVLCLESDPYPERSARQCRTEKKLVLLPQHAFSHSSGEPDALAHILFFTIGPEGLSFR